MHIRGSLNWNNLPSYKKSSRSVCEVKNNMKNFRDIYCGCLICRTWICRYNRSSVCYHHVMYAFQSESTLYCCVNVKELLTRNRRDIWSLSDCNGIRTSNHLLKYLGKLAKWLSCIMTTYLYDPFDCMLNLCMCIWHGNVLFFFSF